MHISSSLNNNQKKWAHFLSFILLLVFGIGTYISFPVYAENPSPTVSPTYQVQSRTPGKYPDKQTPTPVPTRFPNSPIDFLLIDAASGVQLFRKDYPNGSPDFVQVIDLSQGARLDLMYGQIVEPRPEKGVYGHADPRMTSLPIQSYWQEVTSIEKRTFCVTNGAFFYMPEYPTRLAFPLKVENEFVTDGFGSQTYIGQKVILELWGDHAQILELNDNALNHSTAPNIIGGLNEEANKRAKYAVGRTFVGIADRDKDGFNETVLLLNTKTALQTSAASVLRSFGASDLMMLDGGGSTQLLCRNGNYISSDRPVPQSIAVIAAAPPQVSSRLIQKPNWSVLLEGERFALNLQVQNTGIVSWTPHSTQFSLETSVLGERNQIPIAQEIKPGGIVTITQTLAGFSEKGVHLVQISWGIVHQGRLYRGEPFEFNVVILPPIDEEKRIELGEKIEEWSIEHPEEVEQLVRKWLHFPENPSPASLEGEAVQDKIQLDNAVIIPLLMLPVLIILAALIGRMRG